MCDQSGANDPGPSGGDQLEERRKVDLEEILKRRTEELYSSTRSWRFSMSIGAALLFVGVRRLAARSGARPGSGRPASAAASLFG